VFVDISMVEVWIGALTLTHTHKAYIHKCLGGRVCVCVLCVYVNEYRREGRKSFSLNKNISLFCFRSQRSGGWVSCVSVCGGGEGTALREMKEAHGTIIEECVCVCVCVCIQGKR
jgi:hypothetical protein